MRLSLRATALILALFTTAPSYGAGFAVYEKSARGLGTAFAGETAAAEDASTVFGNPAGMTLIDEMQLSVSGFAILPSSQFHDGGSRLGPESGGGPLTGNDGGNAGSLALVPASFLVYPIGDRFRLGFGAFAPFGLTTAYDDGWVGRYHAKTSSLFTVDLQPSFAVKLTDWLSAGVGVDVQYAKARISNALDMGAICRIFGAEQGVTPAACDALGLQPGKVDGHVRVSGDSWSAGWNMGLLFRPTPRTHVGLAFRSMVEHELAGDAKFHVPKKAAILRDASGALVETRATAALNTPERAAIGVTHEFLPGWTVLGDVVWTNWRRFENLTVKFANPAQPTVVQPEGWDDQFRYALGVRWIADPMWTLRMGFAYDATPIPSEDLRTPRVPDSDRYWLSAGLGIRPTSRVQIDVGYAHIFSPTVSVNNVDSVSHHRLIGEYDASADIVGIQLTWNVGWPPFGDPVTR